MAEQATGRPRPVEVKKGERALPRQQSERNATSAGELGSEAPKNVGTLHSLGFSSFRLLWIGSLFSSTGQWIQQTTLGWLAYDMTGSSAILGAVNGMRAIPMLFVSPLAGVAADRMNNKRILQVTQLFLMVVSLLFALDLAFHMAHIWHLFLFTLLTGMAFGINQPVRQSIVFSVVPRYAIPNAVALTSSAFNITRILGPAAAGMLISALGPQGNFFVQSAMYVGVSVTIAFMAAPAIQRNAHEETAFKQLGDGFKYVAGDSMVRTLMVMGLLPVLVAMPYQSLLPVFAKDIFHGDAKAFGFLVSVSGVGGLLGGLVTASLGKFERRGLLQLSAMIGFGLGIVAFSQVHTLLAAAIVLVFTNFCQMVYMTTNQTMVQMYVPDHLRGRVTSILMLNVGLMPLGTLAAGFATEFLDAPFVVMAMGLSTVIIAAGVFLWVPRVRDMRLAGGATVGRRGGAGGGMGM